MRPTRIDSRIPRGAPTRGVRIKVHPGLCEGWGNEPAADDAPGDG